MARLWQHYSNLPYTSIVLGVDDWAFLRQFCMFDHRIKGLSLKREFDTQTVDRIREMLIDQKDVVEKEMFNGLCFMVEEKMCICVTKENLLCRIGEEKVQKELEKGTCIQMMMNGRASRDFVYAPIAENIRQQDLAYWVSLCLAYNPMAKSSKKKRK